MVRVLLVLRRHHLLQFGFDLKRGLAGGHPGAVADAENMRIDRNCRFAESNVEHDIRGFAANAGKRFQRIARARHVPFILGKEPLRQRNDIFSLGTKKADGLDQFADAILPKRHHFLWRVSKRKQRRRRPVDARISRLSREHHRDQQCEWIAVLKLAFWLWIGGLEAAERFLDLRRCPLRQGAGGGFGIRRCPFRCGLYLGPLRVARFVPARFSRCLAGRFFRHDFGILFAMMADNADDLEPTIFSATLTPHRSLGRAGFLLLMLLFGGVSFVTGLLFLLLGAWPVFGFFGLDVLLLYLAFRLNYRHAEAYEQVTVTPSSLKIRKVSHLGRAREWVLNPLWVQLDKVELEEFGIDRLFLVSRGKKLAIASFLGPDEKASFAKELGNALGEARRGPTRTVFE